MPLPADAAKEWHDVFMLFGTASATLIGLMFVAVSVGSSVFSQDKYPAVRSFLSPSVVLFTCVLVAGLIGISPLRNWMLLGVLIGGDGLFGVIYAALVWHRMIRHGLSTMIDLEDRVYYAALPAFGYIVMVTAGILLGLRQLAGFDVLAAVMGLLILVGIRNAWDMTVWSILRQK